MSEKRKASNERDDVGILVRLAGPRRKVPADRTARVREAARESWKGEVRRQTQRRYVWSAAALVAAASLVVAFVLRVGTGAPSVVEATIRIESVAGDLRIHRVDDAGATSVRAAGAVETIAKGAELSTADTGRAAIRLASGHSVRLDNGTHIRLLDEQLVALDRGAIYVDSGFETTGDGDLTIRTPFGDVREIGTQFEVRLDPGLVRVRLREGAVVVSRDGRTYEVVAGTELTLDAEGEPVRREIGIHGTEWGWVHGVTPMLDLEGRSAREFLDWVARERGWNLAFEDETLAGRAGETLLDGSLAGLTLDQALDAVLPTCRLSYRVENGMLLIGGEGLD